MSTRIKQILSPVLSAISIRELSRTNFKKPSTWLYNRLEGHDKEGNPTEFTHDDVNKMVTSLLSLSEQLQMAAYDLAFQAGGGDVNTQRIAVRLVYCKAVSPKHAVVSLDDDEWQSFLKSDERERILIVCKHIDQEHMVSYTRELQWVPLNQGKYLMKY